jgi:hypothetical protein
VDSIQPTYGNPLGLFEALYKCFVGVSKKIEKPIKPRKLEKNNRKNQIEKKTD